MSYKTKRRIVIGVSLGLLILFYLFRNLSEFVRIGGVIFGLFLFYSLDHFFNLDFELKHYGYIIVILFFGILLSPLYFLYGNYDKILHFFMPILGCLLVFHIVDRQKVNFKWKLLITFMFVLSFLTIHEIGEYIIDQIWDFKLQGVWLRAGELGLEKLDLVVSHIDDTMMDLLYGMGGILTFVFGKSIHYFYKKRN